MTPDFPAWDQGKAIHMSSHAPIVLHLDKADFDDSVYNELSNRYQFSKSGDGVQLVPRDQFESGRVDHVPWLRPGESVPPGASRWLQADFPVAMMVDILDGAVTAWRESLSSAWTLDHVAVAVENLDETSRIYTEHLGFFDGGREEVASQKVKTGFMLTAAGHRVELLEATSPESPIAKYLEKRPQGLHHLCIHVPSVQDSIDRLTAAGLRMIDEHPKPGADNKLVAFVHPKSAGGVLIELSQDAD